MASKRKSESLVFDFSEGSDTPIGESHEETLARLAKYSNPIAKFEACVVRTVVNGKLCHYADNQIAILNESEAETLVEFKKEDEIEAVIERVMILVVPIDAR